MSDQQNNADRPAQIEELRFAKKQQWYVASSAVALFAAIFAVARGTSLSDVEKDIATGFVLLIAAFGIFFLFKLQAHLKRVRIELDKKERKPWWRGVDVLSVLISIIFLSAALVVYFLWVPHETL
jgi:SNF family Na+-dependent transporter